LISDHAVDSTNEICRNLDILMMVAANAKEREQSDWQGLFEKADRRYKYIGAKRPEGSRLWIIEAVWEGEIEA